MTELYIQDVTLRDGMHAIRHRIDPKDVGRIVKALDAAGVDAIEVAHGDGLAGGSVNYGPGTRANIDEFTETTSKAIEDIGGAGRGKAIIILNPAEPPLIMRDTVLCLVDQCDRDAVIASVNEMADTVRRYVPGYRLMQEVQFRSVGPDGPENDLIASAPRRSQRTVASVFLEVEGAGHYLPAYAGNLDIMTSAALRVAEEISRRDAR